MKYTWYHSDANENFTSTSVGKKSDNINDTTDNYVQIDGKVTAGTQNKQKIVIGGSGQIVVLDKEELSKSSKDRKTRSRNRQSKLPLASIRRRLPMRASTTPMP